jgi:mannose-6-phosphate isomerase-like protein (cupin superfamily)
MDENTLNSETSSFVERPWGHYHKLFQEPGVWVKRVEVKPGARLSLQKHQKRTEKWIVVTGRGLAVVDGKEIPLEVGSVVDIPLGAVHRMANPGTTKLVFIEVACGSLLSENDIIRLQDDYQRTQS